MSDRERERKEAALAEFLVIHGLKYGVRQAFLDQTDCLYVTFDDRTETKEQAFAALHRLKRLGVVVADCSAYEGDGVLPLTINVGLSSDPEIFGRIQKYLDEEQNPLAAKYAYKVEEIKRVFEDNRLEYGNYLDTTAEKAVKALSAHFKSTANIVFNTDDEYFGDNKIRVEYVPAENTLLARPRFLVHYNRSKKQSFYPDNILLAALSKPFARAQELPSKPVHELHSYGDRRGTIEIAGNPKRLLNEVKMQLYNYHAK